MLSQKSRGLFPLLHTSGPSIKNGLFKQPLSWNALQYLNEDRDDFDFLPDNYKQSYGHFPYDYRSDTDYINKINWCMGEHSLKRTSNKEFLDRLKNNGLVLVPEFLMIFFTGSPPARSFKPNENEPFSFIYPSYIIWANDSSHLSFVGIPDKLELPKHVLIDTTVHPRPCLLYTSRCV